MLVKIVIASDAERPLEQDTIKILTACAEYLEALTINGDPTFATKLLILCRVIFCLITLDDSAAVTSSWRRIFKRATEMFTQCASNGAGAGVGITQCDTAEVARHFLQDVDDSLAGNGSSTVYRNARRPPKWPGHPDGEDRLVEDSAYSRWNSSFDESKEEVPDDMIDVLRSIAPGRLDAYGYRFWRVRRLEDGEALARITNMMKPREN